MEVEEAKSIDRLFEQVKDYDLVLTAEAPLADALNARVEEPRIGRFASTPMHYVLDRGQNEDILLKKQLFFEAARESGASWKRVAYHLDSLIEAWRETGERDRLKGKPGYDREMVDAILEVVKQEDSIYSRLENTGLKEESVAVINLYQFDELDRKLFPEEYDTVESFTGDTAELDGFRVFDTDRQLVGSVADNLERVDPGKAAVVTTADSSYNSQLQAELRSRDVPFIEDRSLGESDGMRSYVKFLRLGLGTGDFRVEEARSLLERLEIDVGPRHDRKYISRASHPGIEELRELVSGVEGSTFLSALEDYSGKSLENTAGIEEFLDETGLAGKEVNRENLGALEFFLDSFETGIESRSGGVLFASPKNVSRVDRPIVFFLGMDTGWNRSPGDRPWIDSEEKHGEASRDFRSLLQSGEKQYYMVKDVEEGEKVVPCHYFRDFTDIDAFTDAENTRYGRKEGGGGDSFRKEETDAEPQEKEYISKSDLETLYRDPKSYMLDRLLDSPQEDHFVKGTVIHDYAEFYINNPEVARERRDELVDIAVEKVKEFSTPAGEAVRRKEVETGIRNLEKFLEDVEVEEQDIDAGERIDRNIYAEELGHEFASTNTEIYIRDEEKGVSGQVDFVASDNEVVDFKTGGSKDAEDLVKVSLLPGEQVDSYTYPEFQHLFYIAMLRDRLPGGFTFSYVYLLDGVGEEAAGIEESGPEKVEIRYVDRDFTEHILEDDDIREAAEAHGVDIEEFVERFEDAGIEPRQLLQDTDPVEQLDVDGDMQGFLERVMEERETTVFSDDIDWFIGFVDRQLEKLEEYRENGFPVGEHADLDRHDHREMILDG
ncbi:MAG: hypothetical protein ABEJ07_04900 [Candidatus Nanohaloarchaea archaeon]